MSELPRSFSDVALCAIQGVDYSLHVREPGGPATVVALHGGALAPHTAELATAIAGSDWNLYTFVAREARPGLRISPLRAREPRLDSLISRSRVVLSIAACADEPSVVRLGGTNSGLLAELMTALETVGCQSRASEAPGIDVSTAYFFNRASEGGIELAVSAALGERLYSGAGCEERRAAFVGAVRHAVYQYLACAASDLAHTLERYERATARISPAIRSAPGRPERNEEAP